jgi:hypothetical protein
LILVDDNHIVFDQLKYCIRLSSKIDLRVQTFEQKDCFILGAILSLCQEYNKFIELNIWVDKDLDVKVFVKAFKPNFYINLIDFIYYRFDFGNFSYKLKGLMNAFNKIKNV